MATDTPLRPAHGASLGDNPSPARPAPCVTGPAVWLRGLIGIDEGLLAWVPEERTRYTWYGALVVNTALLGALSLTLALASFRSDLPIAVVIGVAVVWFWVVLAMDSWLVSSTHGTTVKKWSLLLRFFLSILLGLFIAEPILFQIFDKEIRQETTISNEQRIADYRGMLVSCNPTDGASTADRSECLGYQLKVAGSPAEMTEQIKSNAARTKSLQTQVDAINKALNDKMSAEQRLCSKDNWIWRNGVQDITITCDRARKDSSDFRRTSKVATYEKELSALVAKGRTLAAKKDTATDSYQPLLQRAVDGKTRARAADLDTAGILTKARGLRRVAVSDGFALFITIVLHLLLLCLDALPVLAKLMSGVTMYDQLLGARFTVSRRTHAEGLQVEEECARKEYAVQRHRAEHDTSDRMRRVERAAEERTELEERMSRILQTRRA
ncbi:DUF4407 domain-containing protein [Streptomyces sp. NBC_00564]|uniref:DUF4407 domain-containing protein n=1 Tax=Streptomyces sp. NBC_00564 TaxID=2903663 RepID=UPI00352F97B7|nr:DUF4407 domain-containing protein [Streptomyces sp. NBC_00564]